MRRALVEGFSAVKRQPLVQLIAVATVALSLLLVGAVRLASANLGRLSEDWGRGVELVVFLEDGTTPARTKQISEALRQLPGVGETRVVESAEAYARLRQSLGDRGALLDGVDATLLPVSIEVSLASGTSDQARVATALERLRKTPGVEDIELMGDWVSRVRGIQSLLRGAGLFLGLMVGLACIFIVAATIRLGIFARRDEIEILKLCGATDHFVKAPFLVEGALQGAAGSALALAGLYGIFRVLAPMLEHTLGVALCSSPLTFLPLIEIAAVIPVGALLGFLGSYGAVGRYVEV